MGFNPWTAFHTDFNQSVLLEIAQAMVDTVRDWHENAALCCAARPVALPVLVGSEWEAECLNLQLCRDCATPATCT